MVIPLGQFKGGATWEVVTPFEFAVRTWSRRRLVLTLQSEEKTEMLAGVAFILLFLPESKEREPLKLPLI